MCERESIIMGLRKARDSFSDVYKEFASNAQFFTEAERMAFTEASRWINTAFALTSVPKPNGNGRQ